MGISLNPSTILSGQGLDVSSLVQQIISSQSGELTVWQNQGTTLATQNGVLEGIENNLTNLQTAVAALADPAGALTTQAATSSDTGILTANAQSSAVDGTYEIEVGNLATAGSLYTQTVAGGADASILPSGSTGANLELQVGGASGSTYDIAITPGSNGTLTTLASYINTQSSANSWGVTASVVTDASGSRLALESQNTGASGALAVTENVSTGPLTTADVANPDATILASGQTSGDIQLQIGGSSGTIADLPITQGSNDTLNTLASYINTQSSANSWGVTATVVQDSGGYNLQLTTPATGPSGTLAFTSNNTLLTTNPNPTGLTFDTPQGGTNASLTINGVPFSSPSNNITGAIQGVTLNLVSQSPGTPVQLTVSPDAGQITSAINNFVSAYNTVVSSINAQYAVDPTGATPAPPLESDTSLRSLQSSILADAAYALPGGTGATTVNNGIINLAALGINMNNDGTLTVGANASGQTLAQVVASNPNAVLNLFQNASGTGFANTFNADLTNLTAPSSGPLNVDVTQNSAQQQGLTTNITNFETQLNNEQTALTQQYDAVSASLQAYPLLLQEVTETLGTLGSGTSSSGALISSEPTLTSGL
ncbi:MAG: flagellar filament capping protein FliD [Candidatus Sulfotelmatobacter sp.]